MKILASEQPVRTLLANCAVAAVPLALIPVGWAFLSQIFPIYAGASGYDQDPAYVYLFSGLTLLAGHSPVHVDHPGTPLQVLCALVVLVRSLFAGLTEGGGGDIVGSVLLQPEEHLRAICWVLLILNAGATYYFGRRIFQSSGSVELALSCQSAPLAFGAIAPRLVYLSPEALLIFASLCLLGLLAPIMLGENTGQAAVPDKTSRWAGILCGFGVAVKITFMPMLGLLFLLGARNRVAHAFKHAALALFICILPILGHVPAMLGWIYSLTIHSGHYGTEAADVVRVGAIPGRMLDLVAAFPFFYLMATILLAALILSRLPGFARRGGDLSAVASRETSLENRPGSGTGASLEGSVKVPAVLLLAGLLQTLLVLKHPGVHYMTPVMPTAFVGAAWLVRPENLKGMPAGSTQWLHAALLGLAGIMATAAVTAALGTLRDGRRAQDESLASVRAELKKYPSPLLIGAYRCSLPQCALSFGASYAPTLDRKAAPVLVNFLTYNIWNRQLRVHGEGLADIKRLNGDIAQGRDVLLLSPPYPALDAFSLEPLVVTPSQTLYRVTGIPGSRR